VIKLEAVKVKHNCILFK